MNKLPNHQTYYESMLDNQSILVIPVPLAMVLGLDAAIVLRQVAYWIKYNSTISERQKTHYHDGKWWTYNTYEEWRDNHFPFWSDDTIYRLFGRLIDLGLIVTGHFHPNKQDRTNWYSVDFEAYNAFMELWHMHNCPNRFLKHRSMEYHNFLSNWQILRDNGLDFSALPSPQNAELPSPQNAELPSPQNAELPSPRFAEMYYTKATLQRIQTEGNLSTLDIASVGEAANAIASEQPFTHTFFTGQESVEKEQSAPPVAPPVATAKKTKRGQWSDTPYQLWQEAIANTFLGLYQDPRQVPYTKQQAQRINQGVSAVKTAYLAFNLDYLTFDPQNELKAFVEAYKRLHEGMSLPDVTKLDGYLQTWLKKRYNGAKFSDVGQAVVTPPQQLKGIISL